MNLTEATRAAILFALIGGALALPAVIEPECLSRFDFDYKVLQKLVTLEQDLRELTANSEKQKDEIEHMKTTHRDEIDTLKKGVSDLLSSVSLGGTASTYVRWGRTSCPYGNGTETVHEGYVGGSHQTHSGAATNYLCLPTEPLWGEYDDSQQSRAIVYGSEYEMSGVDQKYFGARLHDGDVPCALCQTLRSTVVMIPGRHTCYDGWTKEYSGYLAAGYHGHTAGSEFVCLDGRPEAVHGGYADMDGKLFYMAETRCGSLKCPPYVDGRELTCVVCSK